MTSKYLFSCPCGRDLHVNAAQAGQPIRCECGAWLNVPSLRELTRSTPASPPKRLKSSSAWGKRERGLLLSAIITSVALVLFGYLQLTRPRIPDPTILTPGEVWIAWQDLRQGPERRLQPGQVVFYEGLRIHRLGRRIALAAAGAGLVSMAVLYALPRRRVTSRAAPGLHAQ